MAQFLTI
jgi:PAS domain S-box-containing protein